MSWSSFCATSPERSIALDGFVVDGPQWDEKGLRANFDHHSGVVREATMSTAMQVMFAIKGGLMQRFGSAKLYINDPDQDTCLATWLLMRHRQFDGVQSHPAINRLLTLNDRLDVTGGAYPMALRDEILGWAFEPYTDLRISGELATAGETAMRNCVDAVHARLDRVMMANPGFKKFEPTINVLYDSPQFKIVDETESGTDARYALFAAGMNAFVSLVAERPDGRFVYSIGRRSRYIDFPVMELYLALNEAELTIRIENRTDFGWGGSDIIGGSSRKKGSSLSWQAVRDVVLRALGQPTSVPTSLPTTATNLSQ